MWPWRALLGYQWKAQLPIKRNKKEYTRTTLPLVIWPTGYHTEQSFDGYAAVPFFGGVFLLVQVGFALAPVGRPLSRRNARVAAARGLPCRRTRRSKVRPN